MAAEKTAIDWLVEQVNSDCLNSAFIRPELVEAAKEMEKRQMVKFYTDELLSESSPAIVAFVNDKFEKHYTKTYEQ